MLRPFTIEVFLFITIQRRPEGSIGYPFPKFNDSLMNSHSDYGQKCPTVRYYHFLSRYVRNVGDISTLSDYHRCHLAQCVCEDASLGYFHFWEFNKQDTVDLLHKIDLFTFENKIRGRFLLTSKQFQRLEMSKTVRVLSKFD